MRLLLIRHGESRHSIEKIIATHDACMGLTAQGLHQAQALARRLKHTLPTNPVLISSPARRARETADQLSQILLCDIEQIEPGLLEMATGEAEGLTWDAYEALFGRFDVASEPHRPFAPGGECWIDFLKRVDALLKQWTKQYSDQTVIAVTHAGFIVVAFLILFAIPLPNRRARLNPSFTSITEWHFSDQIWTLIRFNDSSHLIQSP